MIHKIKSYIKKKALGEIFFIFCCCWNICVTIPVALEFKWYLHLFWSSAVIFLIGFFYSKIKRLEAYIDVLNQLVIEALQKMHILEMQADAKILNKTVITKMTKQ